MSEVKAMNEQISPKEWILYTVGTISAGIALTVGAWQIFDTRSEARERHDEFASHLESRLSSMEKKLDKLDDKVDSLQEVFHARIRDKKGN